MTGRLADSRAAKRAAEAVDGVAHALGSARAEAALDAFESSGRAAILLDACGEIFRMNRAAERLLGSDLKVVRRRLVSADRDASAALDRALHAAIRSLQPLPQAVVLPRRKGRPIMAYPSRPPGIAAGALGPCQAVVVLVDLEARISIVESDLVRAFNLTPAEARLACRLIGEESLETAADGLGIKYETARNFLKGILCKTGTRRQGQLIALLARFAVCQRDRSDHDGF